MSDNLAIEIARHRRTQERLDAQTARADAATTAIKRCIEYLREIGMTTRGESAFPSADYADAIADDLEVLLEQKP